MGTSVSKIVPESVPDDHEQKDDVLITEQTAIDVVCYNVFKNGFNRRGTIDAICNMKADILILQETNERWEKVITNNKSIINKFKYIQCIHDENGYGEGGSIILTTNYQIKSWDVIKKYHKMWYGAHRFTLTMTKDNMETILQVYSIHLVAPFPPCSIKQCCCCCCCFTCKQCGDTKNEFRLKEIRHCLNSNFYDHKLPTLIVGDFNCMDGDCHDMLQNELGLKSSWSVKRHRYALCCRHEPYSWRGCFCHLCCFASKLFDHMYFSPAHFELMHGEVIQTGESDHYPVWARLALLSDI